MTEPEALRFCISCRHYGGSGICARAESDAVNLVTGDRIFPTCESERANADKCGRGARYWSKREEK